jgi:predicted PurR-regulated permease PerM
MFWVLGVPAALVWALVMAVLATIPSLGTFLVWMPVAVYLALTGHWVKAGILVGWGTFVIGTVDNLLYPTLVGTKIQMHTVPVLFAVLGGIALFGISGVVLGPLVLTTAVTLLRFWSPKALPQSEDDPASRS